MNWEDNRDDHPVGERELDRMHEKQIVARAGRWSYGVLVGVSLLIAVVVFSTPDSFGDERPLGVNLLIALVLGPLCAWMVTAIVGDTVLIPLARRLTPRRSPQAKVDPYGPAHQALRAAWKDVIRDHGATCMERECIMRSRQIPAGAPWDAWDLAHDHERGPHDYLGPSHKICNQAEALRRGVTWPGAPALEDLLERAAADEVDRDI
jgi:hypothetical protein